MYVMSYFQTVSESLFLAVSEDGFRWTPLCNGAPILQSTIGARSIRDPHFSQDREGVFHLLFSNSWNSDSIGHCTSRNLLHWSAQELLPVMQSVPLTNTAWSPECFYDGEEELYRIIWSSCVGELADRDDYVHYDSRIWGTTTRDWEHFTTPDIFYDPGYSVIDASVASRNGAYLLAVKDERGDNSDDTQHKAIHLGWSNHATGPYEMIADFVTPPLTEGPTLFRREDENGGEWVMMFDHFMRGHFGAAAGRDGKSWVNITDRMAPPRPGHASVLEVSESVATVLRGAM